MITTLMPNPKQQYFDTNGRPLIGGKVYTYAAGTTTPKATFTDSDGTTPHANPITLNSRGEPPSPIFWSGSYKVEVRDSKDALIYTVDNYKTDPAGLWGLLTTLLSAAGAAMIGFLQAGIGAILRTIQSKLRERVSAQDFGAVNDGSLASATPNRIAIQKAIDYLNGRGGGELVIGGGGTYYVDVVNYVPDAGGVSGITSIKLLDNVSIKIEKGTTIKLKDGAYGPGAYYRMFSSRDVTRLSNARIYGGGTIDGNKAAQTASTQCNNILLECADNVTVEGINCINANGVGMMLRGNATAATNLKILNNKVKDCTGIGIQSSQFNGLLIHGNHISNTGDNSIDVYGEDGDTGSNGLNFRITSNHCYGAPVGIFHETVAQGVTVGNVTDNCIIGATVNRINGQPNAIVITGNQFFNMQYGVRVTGDTNGVVIRSNVFNWFSKAGVLLGAGGNCSYVDVSNNFFAPTANNVPVIQAQAVQLAFCTGKFNTVDCNGITEPYLFQNASGTTVNVKIDSFTVVPNQVGRDLKASDPEFSKATIWGGDGYNTAGPVDVALDAYYGGLAIVTALQGGVGKSTWTIPFIKSSSGTLALGTPMKAVDGADPISGVSVVGNNLRVSLVAGANNYVKYGVLRVPTF